MTDPLPERSPLEDLHKAITEKFYMNIPEFREVVDFSDGKFSLKENITEEDKENLIEVFINCAPCAHIDFTKELCYTEKSIIHRLTCDTCRDKYVFHSKTYNGKVYYIYISQFQQSVGLLLFSLDHELVHHLKVGMS